MFIGIDSGKEKHVCYSNGKIFTVKDNMEGYSKFLDKVCTQERDDEIAVCLENKNSRFARFLVTCGFEVRIMDGTRSSHLRKVLNVSGKKDDIEDAKVLAKGIELFREKLELLKIDKKLERLKRIMEQYKKADKRGQKMLDMLHVDVKEEEPEFYDLVKITNKSTLNYIAKGKVCRELPLQARKIKTHFSSVVKLTAMSALAMREEKDRLKKEMGKELEKFEEYEITDSIEGVGVISSAVLIIVLRENNFPDFRALQAYLGTSPITRSSGRKTYQVKRNSYNKYMGTKILYMAHCTVLRKNWCKEYYSKKRNEGKSHGHALRALANIWLKIIFAMLKHKELYHENEQGLPCRDKSLVC